MCGTEATFRLVRDEMICDFCNTTVSKGEPALKKWKIYQDTIKQILQEKMDAEAEQRFNRERPEEVRRRYEENEEEEEEEEEEEDYYEHHDAEQVHEVQEGLTLLEQQRLLNLAVGELAGLKFCVKLLDDQGLMIKAPKIREMVDQIEGEINLFKDRLGLNNTQNEQ